MNVRLRDAFPIEAPAPDYTVVIMAGGFSRRFGRDKANAPWQGRKMINHVAGRVRALGCEVVAVGRAEQDTAGWEVDRVVHDDPALPDGPLRGVVCGLEACRTPWAFVVSCDAPRLAPELLCGLRQAATPDCLAVVPHWPGHPQPLMALYRAWGAAPLRAMLELGERSPAKALRALTYVCMAEAECRVFDPAGESFLNMNRPEDLIEPMRSSYNEENTRPGSEPCHPLI
jgi:molybdopterin-guanine dinucleotide biosynthesis protein A